MKQKALELLCFLVFRTQPKCLFHSFTVTYFNWSPGEPNGDDCIMMNPDLTWIDLTCSAYRSFICEIAPGSKFLIFWNLIRFKPNKGNVLLKCVWRSQRGPLVSKGGYLVKDAHLEGKPSWNILECSIGLIPALAVCAAKKLDICIVLFFF